MASESEDVDDFGLWICSVEKLFIDIIIEEVDKGNMENGLFKKKTWNSMLNELNAKGRCSFTMKQIKQKFNRLRIVHREFSDLLQCSGFEWDAESNTVKALEKTWQDHLKANPRAARFQKKGCKHFELLVVIFNKSSTLSILSSGSTQDLAGVKEEHDLEMEYHNSGIHANVDNVDSSEEVQKAPEVEVDVERVAHSGEKRLETQQDCQARKEARLTLMSDDLQAWTASEKARWKVLFANPIKWRPMPMEANSSIDPRYYSSSNCVAALNEIEGVNDDTYMKALDKFKDLDWREMFLTMPKERKKVWLDRL